MVSRTCAYISIAFGVVLIVLGSVTTVITNSAIKKAVKDKLEITTSSEDVDDFSNPSTVLEKKVCLFHYPNVAAAGTNLTTLLEVEERCYDFTLKKIKYNVSFVDEDRQVEYWSRNVLKPVSSAVDASLDSDIITHPNLEYFTTLKLGRPLFIQGALAAQNATDLATLITITEPEANIFKATFNDFVNTTIFLEGVARGEPVYQMTQFARSGITDFNQGPIAVILNSMASQTIAVARPDLQAFVTAPARIFMNQYSPSEDDQNAHFSNNVDAFSRVYTGKDDIDKILAYTVVSGNTQWPGWKSPEVIEGARQFDQIKPFQEDDKPDNLGIWVDEAKRVANFIKEAGDSYEQEYKGIDLHRYILDPKALENEKKNPANEKYDMYRGDGLVYMGPVKQNWPIWISVPHFMDVDPQFTDELSGLRPNKATHQSFADIELLTGKTFHGSKRLQLNVRAEQGFMAGTTFPQLFRDSDIFMPLYWGDEAGSISDDDADKFKSSIGAAKTAAVVLRPILIVLGALLVLGMFSVLNRNRGQRLGSSASTDEYQL